MYAWDAVKEHGWVIWEGYLLAALCLLLVKIFRGNKPDRLAGFPGQLFLDDYWLLLGLCLPLALPVLWPTTLLITLGFLLCGIGFLVIWVDALLFRKMTIELDWVGIRTYLWDVREGFAEEIPGLIAFLSKRFFTLLPVMVLSIYGGLLTAHGHPIYSSVLVALVAYTLWRVQRTYVTQKKGVYGLCVALVVLHFLRVYGPPFEVSTWFLWVPLAGVIAGKLVSAADVLKGSFWNDQSFLRHFFKPTYLQDNPEIAIRPEHQHLLQAPPTPQPSDAFGRLRGANVILVTLESVGRYGLQPWHPQGAMTPFFNELMQRGITSKHHFCMTPNTTSAFRAIYCGNYLNGSVKDHLEPLRDAGYTTTFLSRGSKKPFGMGELLEKVGFEKVYGRVDFQPHPRDDGKLSDWSLLNQGLDKLPALEPERPGFLHIHTMDTHSPYRVVDPQNYGRFDDSSDWGRFRNSIEEKDGLLERFFDQLSKAGWLENALVMMVGDHGQAFGEFGYYFHSNAVIKEEIDVPFVMNHSALEPMELSWSTHFDILPTVYDLLGVHAPEPRLGSSLMGKRSTPGFLLTAEPFRAGSPLNFGMIHGKRKYMLDLLFGHGFEMDWEDRITKRLLGEERDYFEVLFYRLLKQHNLIGFSSSDKEGGC